MRGWLKALQPTGPDEAACPHPGLSPMVPVSPTAGFRQRPRVNGTGHLALAGASPTTWSWKPVAVASGAHLSPPTWRKARTERKELLARHRELWAPPWAFHKDTSSCPLLCTVWVPSISPGQDFPL